MAQRLIWILIFLMTACQKLPAETPGLILQRVVFIDAATDGFGAYHLRANNIFEKTDNLSLYLEPVNCTVKKVPQGFKAQLSAVAVLQSVTNPALSQELQIGTMEFIFPGKEVGLYADINLLDVGKLPIDLYQLKMTLFDVDSRQSACFSRKFRVGPSYVQAVLTESESAEYAENLKSKSAFASSTAPIYCLFRPRRIPPESVLNSVFYAENVDGLPPDSMLKKFSAPIERFQPGKFAIHPPTEKWGIGNYRLELFINEEFELVLFFRVTPD
jgi:hypothetical protein